MNDDVAVRAARAPDLDAILQLARLGGLLDAGIAETIDGFLVAVRDEKIIGACGVEEHVGDGLLRTVVVDTEHRGQGIGRALVEAGVERARERGLGSVYLLTTNAAAYFAGLGFEETSRDGAPDGIRQSWEFQGGCPSSATLMICRSA